MLRPATWADVAHVPATTFHYELADGENVQFALEEVTGEGNLAFAALPSSNTHPLDLSFGFDEVGHIGGHQHSVITPSSAIHFSAQQVTTVTPVGHSLLGDSLASFSGDDSDVSSTPSTPPPLSPVFKTENIPVVIPSSVVAPPVPNVTHYGHVGYPSPSSESFSSAPSTPDHTYELEPVPGVIPIASVPQPVIHHLSSSLPPMMPSQNASIAVAPTPSPSPPSSRSTKRRRAVNGVEGTGSGSDDSTSKSRVSWISAVDTKSAANTTGDDDDDEEEDGDSKKTGRRKTSSAGGTNVKQSKRERNKISASKYRKRRKQYLDGLEGKVNELTAQLTSQTKKINALTTENKLLKENLALLKNLLGVKDNKASSHGSESFANNAAGGAAVGGVILFALFACFILFTPASHPLTLGAHRADSPFAVPSSLPIINGVPTTPMRYVGRQLMSACRNPDRAWKDESECCICPGDIPATTSTTPASPSSASPASTTTSTDAIKQERNVVMDVNGHIVSTPIVVDSVSIISTSSQVNDTATAAATLIDAAHIDTSQPVAAAA